MPKKTKFKITALILLIAIIVSNGIENNKPTKATRTIIVPSPEYDTIQKAIYAAETGDIIQVSAGIYRENLFVNVSISIFGQDPVNTIIEAGGAGDVVKIVKPNVVFSGFTIQNATVKEISLFPSSIFIGSDSVIVYNNILKNSICGLQLIHSRNSKIFNNMIFNNSYAGIYIHDGSSNNAFWGNTIKKNKFGLWVDSSLSNIFHHNNFIENTQQCLIYDSTLILDDGSEGNYWSTYFGKDTNFDGIGDTKYSTGGGYDNYPLIGLFSNFTFLHSGQMYSLPIICNSSISNFQYNETQRKLSFDVSGQSGTVGFCRIAMPIALVQDKYTILMGDRVPFNKNWTNSIYRYLMFAYENNETPQKVSIEFSYSPNEPPPSLPILIVAVVILITSITLIVSLLIFKTRIKNKSKSKG